MEDEIDRVIQLVISTITRTTPAESVMKITQSALNLAHVKTLLSGEEEPRPKRGRPPKVAADEA